MVRCHENHVTNDVFYVGCCYMYKAAMQSFWVKTTKYIIIDPNKIVAIFLVFCWHSLNNGLRWLHGIYRWSSFNISPQCNQNGLLFWSYQVLLHKAAEQLNALSRISKYLDQNWRKLISRSFALRSNFAYWSPPPAHQNDSKIKNPRAWATGIPWWLRLWI